MSAYFKVNDMMDNFRGDLFSLIAELGKKEYTIAVQPAYLYVHFVAIYLLQINKFGLQYFDYFLSIIGCSSDIADHCYTRALSTEEEGHLGHMTKMATTPIYCKNP